MTVRYNNDFNFTNTGQGFCSGKGDGGEGSRSYLFAGTFNFSIKDHTIIYPIQSQYQLTMPGCVMSCNGYYKEIDYI